MPYTLVNTSALGFDLARLAGGAGTAAVLRGALGLQAPQLAAVAAAHPGDHVRGTWRRDRLAARRTPQSDPGGREVDAAGLLRRLEDALLGDADALERFVRHEVLAWSWQRSGSVALLDPTAARAADVLVDAALAGYDTHPGSKVARQMRGPLARSGVLPDRAGATGAGTADLCLGRIAGAGPAERARWRRACTQVRSRTAQWAPAMHQATWAVLTTERLRLAADVQLAGVIALRRGGFTSRDASHGVWNALSGVLQASVVEDVLPEADSAVLTWPWSLTQGETPP